MFIIHHGRRCYDSVLLEHLPMSDPQVVQIGDAIQQRLNHCSGLLLKQLKSYQVTTDNQKDFKCITSKQTDLFEARTADYTVEQLSSS